MRCEKHIAPVCTFAPMKSVGIAISLELEECPFTSIKCTKILGSYWPHAESFMVVVDQVLEVYNFARSSRSSTRLDQP